MGTEYITEIAKYAITIKKEIQTLLPTHSHGQEPSKCFSIKCSGLVSLDIHFNEASKELHHRPCVIFPPSVLIGSALNELCRVADPSFISAKQTATSKPLPSVQSIKASLLRGLF